MNKKSIVLFVILVMGFQISFSQTCCSGGVPITGNIGLKPENSGAWQFNLSYDINVLNTLKDETEVLDDDSRERITRSVMFLAGYEFTNRFSAEVFFSWVRQERTIEQFNNTNVVSTNGVGDAVVLLKYNFYQQDGTDRFLQIGAGPKIPVGPSDLTRESGQPIIADLQPGSGAWDGIFRILYGQSLTFRPSMFATASATYALKGRNSSYLENQEYLFGNELLIDLNFNDQFVIGATIWNARLGLRYRQQGTDQQNEIDQPNTGGDWLFLTPGIGINVLPDLMVTLNGNMPMYARVDGTQLSPTYRINFGVAYTLRGSNELEQFKQQ